MVRIWMDEATSFGMLLQLKFSHWLGAHTFRVVWKIGNNFFKQSLIALMSKVRLSRSCG